LKKIKSMQVTHKIQLKNSVDALEEGRIDAVEIGDIQLYLILVGHIASRGRAFVTRPVKLDKNKMYFVVRLENELEVIDI